MEKYAPVIIATLNRYTHLKRCIESLQRNPFASETELIIGLDYPPSEKYMEGYRKIKEYLKTVEGFGKFTVIEHKENQGPVKNFMSLKSYVESEGYDRYILSEDDNEFSPCFLEYVNWGLERFKDDPSVIAVCGYNEVPTDSVRDNFFVTTWFSAWGTGHWLRKWESLRKTVANDDYSRRLLKSMPLSTIFKRDIWLASAVIGSLELGVYYGDGLPYRYMDDTLVSLHPKVSMVRNWGRDGSGQHGSDTRGHEKAVSMPIDESLRFVPSATSVSLNPEFERDCDKYFRIPPLTRMYEICNFLYYKLTGRGLTKLIVFYQKKLRKYFR